MEIHTPRKRTVSQLSWINIVRLINHFKIQSVVGHFSYKIFLRQRTTSAEHRQTEKSDVTDKHPPVLGVLGQHPPKWPPLRLVFSRLERYVETGWEKQHSNGRDTCGRNGQPWMWNHRNQRKRSRAISEQRWENFDVFCHRSFQEPTEELVVLWSLK